MGFTHFENIIVMARSVDGWPAVDVSWVGREKTKNENPEITADVRRMDLCGNGDGKHRGPGPCSAVSGPCLEGGAKYADKKLELQHEPGVNCLSRAREDVRVVSLASVDWRSFGNVAGGYLRANCSRKRPGKRLLRAELSAAGGGSGGSGEERFNERWKIRRRRRRTGKMTLRYYTYTTLLCRV